ELAGLLEVLLVDAGDELCVLLLELLAAEQGGDDAVDVLRQRALLRAGRAFELLVERSETLADLQRGVDDVLELTRGALAIGPDGRVADGLADLLRVLGSHVVDELDE